MLRPLSEGQGQPEVTNFFVYLYFPVASWIMYMCPKIQEILYSTRRMIFDDVSVWTTILLPFFGHSRSIWSTYLWNGWHPAWLQMEETPLRTFLWKNLRKNTAFADCTVSVSFPLHRGMKITNLEKKPGISWGLHRIHPLTSLHPLQVLNGIDILFGVFSAFLTTKMPGNCQEKQGLRGRIFGSATD